MVVPEPEGVDPQDETGPDFSPVIRLMDSSRLLGFANNAFFCAACSFAAEFAWSEGKAACETGLEGAMLAAEREDPPVEEA